MPKNDSLYAHVEVDFVRSHKYISMSPGARCLYLFLWCYALEKKREIIVRPPDHYLSSMACLPHHPIASYLRLMHVLQLLFVSTNYIAVIGLRKKHSKIKFNDEYENTGIDFEYSKDRSFLSFPFLSFPSPPNPPKGEVVEPKKKVKQEVVKEEVKESFEKFISAYPHPPGNKRTVRSVALIKFDALVKVGVPVADLIRAAENFARSEDAARENGRYVPGAQVFLGPKRTWEPWAAAAESALKVEDIFFEPSEEDLKLLGGEGGKP